MKNTKRTIKGLLLASLFLTSSYILAGPLSDAVKTNSVKAVEELLAREPGEAEPGAMEGFVIDVTEKDENGNTPLHLAVQNNNPAIVEMLAQYAVEHNVDLNKLCNNNGANPLHSAAKRGYVDIIKTLISVGCMYRACPMSTYPESRPLHLAALNGHLEAFKILSASVSSGRHLIDIITRADKTGYNALDYAAVRGHENIVRYLLTEHWAGNTLLGDGKKAYRVATPEIKKLLEELRPDIFKKMAEQKE